MGGGQFEVRYDSADAVAAANQRELMHGGAFVRTPNVPSLFAPVQVTVVLVDQPPLEVPGRVVNLMPGGFFVQFDAGDAYDALMSGVELVRVLSSPTEPTVPPPVSAAPPPIPETRPKAAPAPAEAKTSDDDGLAPALSGPVKKVWQLIDTGSGVPIGQQVRALSVADRVRLARHANRPIRGVLIRDTEKRVHIEVVKNPKTTDEEIVEWSGLSGISPLALKWIASQKRLMRNRTIQLNLVKNPMTPQALAMKLVKVVHISECRKIAKSSKVREAIARVARKRVAEAVEKM